MDDLRKRYDKAVQAHAIATAKNEQAERELARCMEELKKYGIEDKDGAVKHITQLKEEITNLRETITAKLEEAGV